MKSKKTLIEKIRLLRLLRKTKIQNKNKQINFSHLFWGNKKIVISFLSILFAVLMTNFLSGNVFAIKADTTNSFSKFVNFGQQKTFEEEFKYVERFNVPNAKATVIYIPQIHKEPTSKTSDTKNDRAARIQKEMYQMMKKLTGTFDINYVMDEADVYGPMPSDKISKIKGGLSDVNEFRTSLNTTLDQYIAKGGSKESADQIRTQSEVKIDSYERNMFLTGSAAVLAATDQNVHVYGSQNPVTLNEARRQLTNLVYMEQRIKQLEGNSSGKNTGMSSISKPKNMQEVQDLLSKLKSNRNINSARSSNTTTTKNILAPVSNFAASKNDQDLTKNVTETNSKLKKLSPSKSFEPITIGGTTASSTQKNPYASSNNLPKLKADYEKAYNEFMKLAKDQRSQEVADNMEKMLVETNQNQAVLVFGAGHKDQIIEAFNKKQINVIVLTPASEKESVSTS